METTAPIPPARHRSPAACMGLLIRGFCMGAADVIPGVSGGTMAFILGIYEELITSIRTFASPEFWKPLLQGRIREAICKGNWIFLACVGAGIALAILTFAKTLSSLLETNPLPVWSFFFGLVLASTIVIGRHVPTWKIRHWGALVLGAITAYFFVGMIPVQTPETWWFLLFSGAIASCAMILPGISGSFLLLLLGKYQTALTAIHERDFVLLFLLGAGAAIGLLLFSHVLTWLFQKYHNRTIVFLMGLMLGSLRKIWPWKEIGLLERNILPQNNEVLWIGVSFMILGIVLVLGLECWAKRKKV